MSELLQEEAFLQLFGSLGSVLFFLAATLILTACRNAFRRSIRIQPKHSLKSLKRFFAFHWVACTLFPKRETEFVNFSLILATNISRFCLGVAQVLWIINNLSQSSQEGLDQQTFFSQAIPLFFGALIASLLIGDLIPRALGSTFHKQTLDSLSFISSLFLLICFPISYLIYKMPFKIIHSFAEGFAENNRLTPDQLISILEEVSEQNGLEPLDRKLIESVISFRGKIVREVMVPRVNLTALSAETTVRKAAQLIEKEGYSRIPVYRTNVDHIIGILMSKDVLARYRLYESQGDDPKVLDAPISTLTKSALYTPETKKIASLLQEFRAKQVHIAIVVDEYGGTEGLVTIEDILEQLVGEIEDEYDEEEADCISVAPNKWIVDARIGILDLEEQVGLRIPQEGDYDTIGGYIFHRVGSIPEKGQIIHHDCFEMEILSSNERYVEKVSLTLLDIDEEEEEEIFRKESSSH